MKKQFLRAGLALCCSACLLAGCTPVQAPAQTTPAPSPASGPTVARYPEPWGEEFVTWLGTQAVLTPNELGQLDLRCADLRAEDLSGMGETLLNAAFDDRTQWPETMPQGVDVAALMELGKDPGLGVRALHDKGITGKGVGIAIIDQTLLADHAEYAGRLRYYAEYNGAAETEQSSMHGPAVVSIALGETVGVAPEALLYYIADDHVPPSGDRSVRDMTHYAADIDRFVALNETLPEGERIRVISISSGYMPDTSGAAEMDAAIARARAAGIAVMWPSSGDPLASEFGGVGRTPYGDPDALEARRPGIYLENYIYSGELASTESLLVPMDRRTTASPTGAEEYVYYTDGGISWAIPYVAGLYALACQVKSDVTFEGFVAAAKATARPVSVTHEGRDYPYGRVVDPAALLDALK